jgi:hypothetical protein
MLTRRFFLKNSLLPAGALYLSPALAIPTIQEPVKESPLSKMLKALNRETIWNQIAATKVQFKTFHCQGMVKIGADFWISSVELTPAFASDRSSGKGHLFKMDANGKLLADVAIGEGSIFHPSGIDFDGTHIWIAAAEYKPNSHSIIYRFDPQKMALEETFRWDDHVGGVARDTETNILHGVSWGSRRFYQWPLNKAGQVRNPSIVPTEAARLNHSFYIDYQDNQYLGNGEMLYTGLNTYKRVGKPSFSLGGIEIVDLNKGMAVHQVPIQLWSSNTDSVMTQNPGFFEATEGNKLRGYFMPDDNESTLFVYEASLDPPLLR